MNGREWKCNVQDVVRFWQEAHQKETEADIHIIIVQKDAKSFYSSEKWLIYTSEMSFAMGDYYHTEYA